MPDLTHPEKMKILREVILSGGAEAPDGESKEAAAWRQQCQSDVQQCCQQGLMPEIPWDSHDPDD